MARLIAFRPPRIAMGALLIASAAHFLFAIRLHPPLPVAAAVVAMAGCGLMLRAWWLFRRAGTAICPTEASSALVTHDVFAMTRNPMYLGIVVMLAGIALAVGTLPFYVAACAYALAMDRVFCPYEEAKAAAEFGDEYADYARRVRRWI